MWATFELAPLPFAIENAETSEPGAGTSGAYMSSTNPGANENGEFVINGDWIVTG